MKQRDDAFQPTVRCAAEHFAGAIPQPGLVDIVLCADQLDHPIVHLPVPKFQPGHIAAGNGNVFGKFGLRQPKRLANFTNPFANGHSNDSFQQQENSITTLTMQANKRGNAHDLLILLW